MQSPNESGGSEADNERMEYDDPEIERMVKEVETAVAEGNYREATKLESMEVRLAALAAIVRDMQQEVRVAVKNERAKALAAAPAEITASKR